MIFVINAYRSDLQSCLLARGPVWDADSSTWDWEVRDADGDYARLSTLDQTARLAAAIATEEGPSEEIRIVTFDGLNPKPPAGKYRGLFYATGQGDDVIEGEPQAVSESVYWDGEAEVDMAGIAANVEAVKGQTDKLDFTGTAGALKSESTNMRGTDN